MREGDWQVAPAPDDLQNRRVEITGPADRKMMINALNSGASGFMVDLEDSMSPTWTNVVQGQVNLTDAIERTIEFTGPDGREYELNDEIATLLVRPRGWHLPEKHIVIDGTPRSPGALVDAGLYLFRNAQAPARAGSGPYFYLPKMESHREARLWNDVFTFAEQELGIDHGTIKATVLIETLPAAFEMDEILYELRDHSAGLNAGRWDYIFSAIKTFRERPEFVLPDRADVKMTVPFMHAYTELLVKTCHRRGAHAMGGMAALIPSRKDEEANAEGDRGGGGRQEARGRGRLRRHLGRAPRRRLHRDGRVRQGAGRPRQPGRSPARRRGRSAPPTCSTCSPRRARSPSRACATTSTSASSTSRRGCAATAPRASTG